MSVQLSRPVRTIGDLLTLPDDGHRRRVELDGPQTPVIVTPGLDGSACREVGIGPVPFAGELRPAEPAGPSGRD